MANKGLGRDSLLKMVHNPGGHWHPGKGPAIPKLYSIVNDPKFLGKWGWSSNPMLITGGGPACKGLWLFSGAFL